MSVLWFPSLNSELASVGSADLARSIDELESRFRALVYDAVFLMSPDLTGGLPYNLVDGMVGTPAADSPGPGSHDPGSCFAYNLDVLGDRYYQWSPLDNPKLNISGADELTAGGFYRSNVWPTSGDFLIGQTQGGGNTDDRWRFRTYSDAAEFRVDTDGPRDIAENLTANLPTERWIAQVGRWKQNDTVARYSDGVLIAQAVASNFPADGSSTRAIRVGGNGGGSGRSHRGYIHHAFFTTRAWTPSEVDLYSSDPLGITRRKRIYALPLDVTAPTLDQTVPFESAEDKDRLFKPEQWDVDSSLVEPRFGGLRANVAYEWMLWERSGGKVRNTGYAGQAFDGTLVPSSEPVWVDGVRGPELRFGGTNKRFAVDSTFTPPPQGVVEIFARVEGTDTGHQRLLGFADAFEIAHRTSSVNKQFANELYRAGSNYTLSVDSYDRDEWLHLFFGFRYPVSTQPNAYVAVARMGTVVDYRRENRSQSNPGSGTLTIGNRTGSSAGDSFEGDLSFVRIWDRWLDLGEVKALATDPFGMVRRARRFYVAIPSGVGPQPVQLDGVGAEMQLEGGEGTATVNPQLAGAGSDQELVGGTGTIIAPQDIEGIGAETQLEGGTGDLDIDQSLQGVGAEIGTEPGTGSVTITVPLTGEGAVLLADVGAGEVTIQVSITGAAGAEQQLEGGAGTAQVSPTLSGTGAEQQLEAGEGGLIVGQGLNGVGATLGTEPGTGSVTVVLDLAGAGAEQQLEAGTGQFEEKVFLVGEGAILFYEAGDGDVTTLQGITGVGTEQLLAAGTGFVGAVYVEGVPLTRQIIDRPLARLVVDRPLTREIVDRPQARNVQS